MRTTGRDHARANIYDFARFLVSVHVPNAYVYVFPDAAGNICMDFSHYSDWKPFRDVCLLSIGKGNDAPTRDSFADVVSTGEYQRIIDLMLERLRLIPQGYFLGEPK